MRFAGLRRSAAPRAKSALLKSGCYAALRTVAPSRGVGILRYHAICGSEGHAYADPSICVSPAAFERQVQYLASNYRVLSLADAVMALRERQKLPPNSVAITFDDGYADNLWAARILARHGLTGTFFLTAGCIDGVRPFWPAEIRALIAAASAAQIRLTWSTSVLELPLRTGDDRAAAIRCLTRLFKSQQILVREQLRDQLRAQAPTAHVPSSLLTWNDVAEMQSLGMSIGAHTLTHANLPSAGPQDATTEIVASKAMIERELGIPVTLFAYPNGGAERYYTPEVQRLVAGAGFQAAVSSRNGFASSVSDIYALERIQVAERLEDLIFGLEVERFAFKPRQRAAC